MQKIQRDSCVVTAFLYTRVQHRDLPTPPMGDTLITALLDGYCYQEGVWAGFCRMISRFHERALECLDGLFGYALTLTRNHAEAEDLVQDTYLKATQAAARLQPGSEIKTWMFTILRNRFLNGLRHRRSGPQWVDLSDEDGSAMSVADTSTPNPLLQHLQQTERELVRAAIAALPDPFREIIRLREFENLSYAEIAQILNCPIGTVMSRLGRARNQLRDTLALQNAVADRNTSQRGASV